MKKTLLSIKLTLIQLLAANYLMAQIPTLTNDVVASPSNPVACPVASLITGVNNSGNDDYVIPGGGGAIAQVMVFDGPIAGAPAGYFSWDHNGTKGSIALNTLPNAGDVLYDPDVVARPILPSNAEYAMLVAEVVAGPDAGKIFWQTLIWSAGAFTAAGQPKGYVGATLAGHTCHNPNIDANKVGRIIMTWYEEFSTNTTVTISGGGYVTTTPTLTLMDDIYGLPGFIYGLNCSNSVTIASTDAFLVNTYTATTLFERNRFPDVSISDTLYNASHQYVCSFIWNRQFFVPSNFSIGTDIIVRQILIEVCTRSIMFTYTLTGNAGTVPRIASRPDAILTSAYTAEAYDFSAVDAAYGLSCSCGVNGCTCTETGLVQNWWKTGGTVNLAGTTINSGIGFGMLNLTNHYNYNPVVAYRDTTNGEYIVSWTHGNSCGTTLTGGALSSDIVALTLFNGATLAGAVSYGYAFVNKGNICAVGTLAGDQIVPSISGRYMSGAGRRMSYLFFDANKSFMGYKLSGRRAGYNSSSVRIGNPNGNGDPDIMMNAYPNPFNNGITINLEYPDGVIPMSLLISNMQGQLIQTIELQSGVKEINWTADKNISKGNYIVILKTSEGEKSIIVSKE